jgi:cytochrome oxidase Cu insertion factor (SCO1/SenC/PrrC family)
MRALGGVLAILILVGAAVTESVAAAEETRLIDQFGRPVDAREFGGHWLLVYFGYTSCREICPAALTTMTAVLARLGPLANAIDPLFVTLDPAHDPPAVMRAFIAHFHPRIRALTGSPQAVADAARTFEVPWQRSSTSSVSDHGTLFYLVAPDGSVVQALHPQQPIDDLAAALVKHLSAASRQ